jgi:hypothetical protein
VRAQGGGRRKWRCLLARFHTHSVCVFDARRQEALETDWSFGALLVPCFFFLLLCFALFLYSVFSCMSLNPCVVPGAVRFCSTLVELWSSRFIALYSVWSNQELLVPGFKISAKFGNFGGGRKKTPKFCNALIHVMYNSRLAFFY